MPAVRSDGARLSESLEEAVAVRRLSDDKVSLRRLAGGSGLVAEGAEAAATVRAVFDATDAAGLGF